MSFLSIWGENLHFHTVEALPETNWWMNTTHIGGLSRSSNISPLTSVVEFYYRKTGGGGGGEATTDVYNLKMSKG